MEEIRRRIEDLEAILASNARDIRNVRKEYEESKVEPNITKEKKQ
jgi:hypothetical protein